jgi:hypothetical protein
MQRNFKNTAFWAIGLFVLTLAFTSCKKEGCTDPTSLNYDPDAQVDDGTCTYPEFGSMKVKFNYVFGSTQEPWDIGTTLRHPKTGDTLTFSTFKYYVSNIRLKNSDGSWWSEPESYHLVCASCPEASTFTVEGIPSGTYTDMEYTMGVDSARNVSGAQTGALSVANGMSWSWNAGYIMLKAEGQSPNSDIGAFTFHLGGFSGQYNVVTPKATDFFGNTLAVDGVTEKTVNFMANPARLWHNAPSVDSVNTIHMPGAGAYEMAWAFYDNITFNGIED